MVADDGSQVGILPLAEALRMAEEKDLDLVNISPKATPPVCKIMDYGRYRFELEKTPERSTEKSKSDCAERNAAIFNH